MRKFTPIAMRCTKEQFEAVRPNLGKIGSIGYLLGAFNTYFYLCNNYSYDYFIDNKLFFDFINLNFEAAQHENIHETWNEKIFLDACGIETDTYEITKETIIKYQMKDEFPEVFEVKLEVGKWYVFESGTIGFFKGLNIDSYGIHFDSKEWFSEHKWFYDFNSTAFNYCRLATHEEVEQALIKEVEKRGYKEGVYVDRNNISDLLGIQKINLKRYPKDQKYFYDSEKDYLEYHGFVVYSKGQWAEIIQIKQMTQEEIEKELGYKIEIV